MLKSAAQDGLTRDPKPLIEERRIEAAKIGVVFNASLFEDIKGRVFSHQSTLDLTPQDKDGRGGPRERPGAAA